MSMELVIKILIITSLFLALFGKGIWKLIGMFSQVIILILLGVALYVFEKQYLYVILTLLLIGWWTNDIKKYFDKT